MMHHSLMVAVDLLAVLFRGFRSDLIFLLVISAGNSIMQKYEVSTFSTAVGSEMLRSTDSSTRIA